MSQKEVKAKAKENTNVTVDIQEVLNEKGAQSTKNLANGKEEVKVSLTDVITVRFKRDYGFMKKDQEARVSELSYDLYNKAGVVDKI